MLTVMKELEPKRFDKIEITRDVRSSEVYLGSVRLQPGQVYWELDLKTMKINVAELSDARIELRSEVDLVGNKTGKLLKVPVRDLKSKNNCMYVIAINAKNAHRKFLKRIKYATQKNYPGSETSQTNI